MAYQTFIDASTLATTTPGQPLPGCTDPESYAPDNTPIWFRNAGGQIQNSGQYAAPYKPLVFTGAGVATDRRLRVLYIGQYSVDAIVRMQGQANFQAGDYNGLRQSRKLIARIGNAGSFFHISTQEGFGNVVDIDTGVITYYNGHTGLLTQDGCYIEVVPTGATIVANQLDANGVRVASVTATIPGGDALLNPGYMGVTSSQFDNSNSYVFSAAYDDGAVSASALAISETGSGMVSGVAASLSLVSDHPVSADTAVALSATNATLSVASLTLTTDGAPKAFAATPSGLGKVTVTATAQGLTGATLTDVALGGSIALLIVGDSQAYYPAVTDVMVDELQSVGGSRKVAAVNAGVIGKATGDWLQGGQYLANAASAGLAAGATTYVCNLGTNDLQTAISTTKATYKANLAAIHAYMRSRGYTEGAFCKPYTPVPTYDYVGSGNNVDHLWAGYSESLLLSYHDAIDELAAADPTILASSGGAHFAVAARAGELVASGDGIHTASGARLSTVPGGERAAVAARMLGLVAGSQPAVTVVTIGL